MPVCSPFYRLVVYIIPTYLCVGMPTSELYAALCAACLAGYYVLLCSITNAHQLSVPLVLSGRLGRGRCCFVRCWCCHVLLCVAVLLWVLLWVLLCVLRYAVYTAASMYAYCCVCCCFCFVYSCVCCSICCICVCVLLCLLHCTISLPITLIVNHFSYSLVLVSTTLYVNSKCLGYTTIVSVFTWPEMTSSHKGLQYNHHHRRLFLD